MYWMDLRNQSLFSVSIKNYESVVWKAAGSTLLLTRMEEAQVCNRHTAKAVTYFIASTQHFLEKKNTCDQLFDSKIWSKIYYHHKQLNQSLILFIIFLLKNMVSCVIKSCKVILNSLETRVGK